MDHKRSLLYPPLEPTAPPTHDSGQIEGQGQVQGVVVIEAPPSYDVAIGSGNVIVAAQPLPTVQQPLSEPPTLEPTIVRTAPQNLGPNPCNVLCPVCGAQETTRMTHTANNRTHIGAALLCIVGWCCCACCVPYCMSSCRTGNHYCARCNTFLGTYNPRGIK